MESKTYALFTGIFFLVLVAIGAALAVWMARERGAYGQNLTLVSSESVTGLNREAPVLYRGIPVGKVADLRINSENQKEVVIVARLTQPLRLSAATRARLVSQGITGLSNVELVDEGGAGALDQDSARIPVEQSSLQRVGASLPEAVDELRRLTATLADTFSPAMREDLHTTMHNVSAASAEFPTLVKSAHASMGGVDRLTSELRSLAADLKGEIRSVQVEANGALSGIKDMAGNMDRSAARIDRSVLPQLEQSLQGVDELVSSLNEIAVQQRDDPQRLIFGRKPGKAGPGENGFGGGM
ncbi:hypothetical protein LMG31506_04323 [Cupriavidus yeoncheonensis]|uniref:Mce/MlaD domain-containing protein n=1 Tax=Cupriavidus yeoncheonensis TaxID=1462994 RepID=A0A916N603_9BURK|nr:MlaD family protein [Cupriavidus yeoncheonensis]CAG2150906.1 hypothetical protein LMG31506_04323 [Cupriavidus yeoncheonensis]